MRSFVNEPSITLPPEQFEQIPSPTPLPPEQQAVLNLQSTAQEINSNPQASISAVIKTSKGDITIVLSHRETPFAVANFYEKANADYYQGLTFHRVENWVIQGGDPLGTGTGGGTTITELNNTPFTRGAVGYAASPQMEVGQGQRISSGSQFFIVKEDAEHLNGQYSNFGVVTDGIDIVDAIEIGDTISDIVINEN